ncbi:MAG: glycosyltransferase family 2 protein [Actinobacteria bacterium]|jgi:glycosyltransferase involved in cell wall biosynthesis|nr:glycosyltransferase family 2 protein [Actinomycetota bacterium]NDA95291.1 glycosyltransferase family 2 protein [Actinomycetota bacterium]NDH80521.1 glycosyltransferase family 2 protein [Actinomycetota bacterium]NDH98934.1 glycosyltransferase family 2 protein [Actinomycetota bacterium]NDI07231.1 glycosyltransferase family 2 protein [Actinomycetota bacterium]
MATSGIELSLSPGSELPAVSVILPVLNEESHLASAVRSILSQNYQGDIQVILALGPSKDKTDQIAQGLVSSDSRISIVRNPSGRTASGLNLAINKSTNPVIVRVDAHSELQNNYISLAIEVMKSTGAVNVGGIMGAKGTSKFERSVAAAMRSPLGVGASRFHTGGESGYVDTVYLGVFIRAAVVAVGGFDERFIRAQDWELNYRLRQAGGKIFFDPRLHVTYRPRSTFKALAKQYFEYGRWRRVVSRRHQGTINYRYLAPPLSLIGTVLSIFCALIFSPIFIVPAAIYGVFLLVASMITGKGITEKLLLPIVLFTMQMSWGLGFLTSPKTLAPAKG